MSHRLILLLFLGADALILFFESSTLSISYNEAQILYQSSTVLHYIVTASLNLFGTSDFALRLPMIFFHLISVLLLYSISERYLRHDRDRLWLVLIYMLLPGINSAALLVDESGLVIMLLLLFIYSRKYSVILQYSLLAMYLFVDFAFAFLYFGLFIHGFRTKNMFMSLFNFSFFIAAFYLYGFDVHGSPKGHFLDALGLYAAIFSPIVFIYIFYVLYRRFITKRKDIIWCISATVLVTSLLLSLRQQIAIQYFAPYLILAMPLAAQTFFNSYRVRLKMFRGKYRAVFTVSLILLVANALIVMFNKELYLLIEKPSKHFAYDHHVAKELASALRDNGISCIDAGHGKMQLRLQFYGISKCTTYRLKDADGETNIPVTIRYSGVDVYKKYVSKVPKFLFET